MYIVGISIALSAGGFDAQAFLVKHHHGVLKMLHYSWGKLLHCNCRTWGIRLASNYYYYYSIIIINDLAISWSARVAKNKLL